MMIKIEKPGFLLTMILLLCGSTSSALAQPQPDIQFESTFGQQGFFQFGTPPNGFGSPTGISFHSNSELIIADQGNTRIQVCDLQGSCTWLGITLGQFKNQAGTFDLPHGVESNRNGQFAVADEDNHAIQLCLLDNSCKYKGEENSQNNPPSSGLGRWAFPGDVAFDSQLRIYGLDSGNNRVQILDPDSLDFEAVFGGSGSELGKFNSPKGISIGTDDTVYIADTGNNRIQVCDSEGDNCSAFGSFGTAVGQFDEPIGIEVDSRDFIWIADTGNNRVQVCDRSGSCSAFGSSGTGEGQFDRPSDVAVSASGRLAVVDTNNHRIQLFSTGSFTMNPGLNDAWFDPATDGQGFFITVFPDLNTVLLAWFTYDTEQPPEGAMANIGDAGHRWLTAIGPLDGDRAVMEIDIASGGIFDAADPVSHTPGGTITVIFDSCNSGVVEYDIDSINQQGSVPIQRVAKDNVELCEALLTP